MTLERAPDSCIICSGREKEVLIQKESWTVYRCIRCGLGVLDPRPSKEEMVQLYRGAYFADHYDEGLQPGSKDFLKRLGQEDHRIKLIRCKKRSGELLDIGCGLGYFLAASREHGFEVQGQDVSEEAAAYVRSRLGIPLKVGDMEDIDYHPFSFDIITMWHSLEHMRDPNRSIQIASSWLKKDGILVIDVPNHKGNDARFKGHEWDGWSLPFHFWHFTPGSIELLLARNGFRIVKRKHYHSEVIKDRLSPVRLLRPLARVIAKMYSGNSVAIVAVKHP